LEIALKNRTILQGDVLEKLREIPNESIDCVITSPPYWGLRDYQAPGQWGLEDDFHDYLEKMRTFMHLLKMVLKPTGTVWINLGDTYSGGIAHADWSGNTLHGDLGNPKLESSAFKSELVKNHIQAKSRYGIPERFYANCIDDGWLARNHIPWIKENAMPSSVKDRFTNKWESVFFFAKEGKYYFNLDAVREKPIGETKPFNRRIQEAKKGFGQLKMGDLPGAFTQTEQEDMTFNKKGERIEGVQTKFKQDNTLGPNGKPLANYKGFNERYLENEASKYEKNSNAKRLGMTRNKERSESKMLQEKHSHMKAVQEGAQITTPNMITVKRLEWSEISNPNGKNPGDIFKINPRPYPEAHFATFPIDLPLKILKCGCAPNGFVLDPFFGSGTVGMAAEKLGLNWIGIELKKEYIELAKKRLVPFRNEKIL